MEEGRRQAYLAALGIPLWTARYELPAAALSEALVFEPWLAEPSDEDSQPLTAVPSAAAAEQPSMATVAKPAMPVLSPKAVAAAQAVPEPPAATSASFPRFSCFIQRITPTIVLVIDTRLAPDLSAQEYRLLGNILNAVGADSQASRREGFRWPMHESNPRFPRDVEHAREALAALLVKQGQAERYVVLGETLGAYVRGGLPKQKVAVVPALSELLHNPVAKRQLWQAFHD